MAVLAVHWAAPYTHGFLRGGYVGVDLFLVLSGFVITSILWRGSGDYLSFLWRRVKRLYPALIGLLVVGLALVWALGAPVPFPDAVTDAFTALVQASSIVRASDTSALGPFGHTWSLAVEWIFYLAWPLAVVVLRRVASIRTAAIATLVAAVVAYAGSLALSSDWFYYGPVSRSAQLLFGSAVALWIMAGGNELANPSIRRTLIIAAPVSLFVIATYVMVAPSYSDALYRFGGFPITTLAAGALIAAGRVAPGSVSTRLLGSLPLATLGRVSYSLYLWHNVAREVVSPNLALPRPLLGLLVIGITVVTTWASYRWLERPLLSSRRGALTGTTLRTAETPPGSKIVPVDGTPETSHVHK